MLLIIIFTIFSIENPMFYVFLFFKKKIPVSRENFNLFIFVFSILSIKIIKCKWTGSTSN